MDWTLQFGYDESGESDDDWVKGRKSLNIGGKRSYGRPHMNRKELINRDMKKFGLKSRHLQDGKGRKQRRKPISANPEFDQ